MGSYTGTTIAFSHKGGFWKTRYSYTPTCYAVVDNVMISTNKTSLDTNSTAFFWEHEVNATHNKFYEKQYKSSLTLVSNQDPSAVKLFKALSLESNSKDWAGRAATNINPAGAPQNELQLGNIKGFVTKEGNQYSELPKSLNNSNSNVDYVCQLDSIIDPFFAEDPLNLDQSSLTISASGWEASVLSSSLNTPLLGGSGSKAIFVNSSNQAYTLNFVNDEWVFTALDPEIPQEFVVNSPTVYIHSYNSNGTITLGVGRTITLSGITALVNFTNNLGSEWDTIQLYSITSPDINGDPMRGQYLHLHLENDSTTPVETYAINVDFENTKLDGSKGSTQKKPKQKASPSSK